MYITKEELQTQGITGSDTYLDSLVSRVESVFNMLIGDDEGVMSATRTEELQDVHNATEILLKYNNPTSLTTINGESVASSKILGRKLLLENPVSVRSSFPYLLTIVYVAGYETVPEDIKQVCFSLASYLNNTKNSAGISSFQQDLLQVSYGAKEEYDYLERIGQSSIINKYKIYYAYSL